jgi:hypothetical protein
MLDEFQDVDGVQFDVLKMLVSRYGTKVFAVGDWNQNIYGFRNSSPKFLDAVQDLGTPSVPSLRFVMNTNYRPTREVVEFCTALIPDAESHEPRMTSFRGSTGAGKPRIAVFDGKVQEINFVVEEVSQHLLIGIAPWEIAVLARKEGCLLCGALLAGEGDRQHRHDWRERVSSEEATPRRRAATPSWGAGDRLYYSCFEGFGVGPCYHSRKLFGCYERRSFHGRNQARAQHLVRRLFQGTRHSSADVIQKFRDEVYISCRVGPIRYRYQGDSCGLSEASIRTIRGRVQRDRIQ